MWDSVHHKFEIFWLARNVYFRAFRAWLRLCTCGSQNARSFQSCPPPERQFVTGHETSKQLAAPPKMSTRSEVVVVKCVCSTCWGPFRRALRDEVVSNFWSATSATRQNSRAYAEIEESDNTVMICLEPDIGIHLSRAAAQELAQSLVTISEVYECFVQLPSRQVLVLKRGTTLGRLCLCGLGLQRTPIRINCGP